MANGSKLTGRKDRIHAKHHGVASGGNRFSVIEAYKTIRTNLQFSFHKKTGNIVIITSCLPRDGKSTVVANIGVAFAQAGIQTLIVDADMRKPRMSKFFNVPVVPGLSNVLAGLSPLADAIQSTSFNNLKIITSGLLPPNPAELLAGTAMEEMMDSVREDYDVIILDTPPVNIVSDAVIATRVADGIVIVTKHAVTTHPDLSKAIKSLEFVNAKIFGLILNSMDYSKIYGKNAGYYSKQFAYGKSSYSKSGYGGFSTDSIESAITEKLFNIETDNTEDEN